MPLRIILVLWLILAGCAPAPIAPAPEPAAEAPEPVLENRTVYRAQAYNYGVLAGLTEVAVPVSGEVAVARGPVTVTWVFARDRSDLKERIRTEGYEPEHLNQVGRIVQARFPADGPARWEAWLAGVDGSRVTLVRRPEPNLRVRYLLDAGTWEPITEEDTALPAGPLTLEFTFDQPMEPADLDLVVEMTWGRSRAGGDRGRAHWLSPQQARWEMPALPERLDVAVEWFRGTSGLFAVSQPVFLRTREHGAWLDRVNPATGQTERIMDLPSEILGARLSPDRTRIALQAYQRTTDGGWEQRVFVADIAAGEVNRVEMPPFGLAWHPDGSLISFGSGYWGQEEGWTRYRAGTVEMRPGTLRFAVLSPDGNLAAALRPQEHQHHEIGAPLPLALVIHDLQTGVEEVLPSFVNGWYWGKEGDWTQWLAWSPTGQKIAALDPVARTGQTELAIYDRAAQQRIAHDASDTRVWGSRLSWSPDGQWILAGDRLLPAGGGDALAAPGVSHLTVWDPTGTRYLTAAGEWEKLFILDLATGTSQSELGSGMPVGWDGDSIYVIRWPGAHGRYGPEM